MFAAGAVEGKVGRAGGWPWVCHDMGNALDRTAALELAAEKCQQGRKATQYRGELPTDTTKRFHDPVSSLGLQQDIGPYRRMVNY